MMTRKDEEADRVLSDLVEAECWEHCETLVHRVSRTYEDGTPGVAPGPVLNRLYVKA